MGKFFKHGHIPDSVDERDHRFGFVGDPATLPDSLSMREHEGPIFNQGQLGSCTGNSISKAIQTWRKMSNCADQFTPSRLQIYYDERVIEGTVDQDAGAMIRDGFKVINTLGVIPEDSNAKWSWPYSSTDERWKQAPPDIARLDARLHKTLKYQRVNQDLLSIKGALAAGMPLVIGIAVYPSFEGSAPAKTGVIPMPGLLDKIRGAVGGHALCANAYTPDGLGGPNSWGADWGDAGHYLLPWKYILDPKLTSDIWAVGLST